MYSVDIVDNNSSDVTVPSIERPVDGTRGLVSADTFEVIEGVGANFKISDLSILAPSDYVPICGPTV